ncbi:MAG: 50S ribosomal protein L23 [Patescibacteria group bacterium]|nr:50S ribosomal protein L23 [Patescibacteria group bacterium]MDE1988545.1 50S ribosomal protein L23 [Patescibacteria group bacterium]MDE2217897.1 50S ribosomal protein L23 [Patescibacteria group bacterium]
MAILGTKKNTKAKAKVDGLKPKESAVAAKAAKRDGGIKMSNDFSKSSSVILKPRITEKSGISSQELNAYTFEIKPSASKNEVAKAVTELYKVSPLRVNMTHLPRKRIFSRGKKGWSGGVKKAVVYLKKEDKIEFI